jgi:hypothetical protein
LVVARRVAGQRTGGVAGLLQSPVLLAQGTEFGFERRAGGIEREQGHAKEKKRVRTYGRLDAKAGSGAIS